MTNTKYITVLSVIACVFVIMLHSYTLGFEETSDWILERFIRGIAYCAVPIFFMISGATLIDYRERYDTKTFFKKRLLKTVLPLILWSIIYFVVKIIRGKIDTNNMDFRYIVDWFINIRMNSVFWFLVVIIGIYLCIPVISLIPKENRQKAFLYIIILSFITISFLPLVFRLARIDYNNDLRFPLTATGWIMFIFIGYYISHYDINLYGRITIYSLGLIGYLLFTVGTIIWSYHKHEYMNYFDEYTNVPCLLFSSAFFLLFKNIKFASKVGNGIFKVSKFIAPTTLGIYIIHMLIKDEIILTFWQLNGFWGDTLLVFVILIPSFIIVKLIKLIPYSNYVFP